MSHIVTIQTQVRDPAAIRAACERLKLPHPVYGETRLFSGSQTGWQVFLPGRGRAISGCLQGADHPLIRLRQNRRATAGPERSRWP